MLPCRPFKGYGPARGFTLIELIMVLLIISLGTSIVFVAVSSGLLTSSDKKFARDFTTMLSRAKTASLGRGRMVSFLIDGENRQYCIEGRAWKEIPSTIQVSAEGLKEKDEGIYAVVFYPDGSSSGGEIDLEYDETGDRTRIKIGKLVGIVDVESSGG